MPRAEPGSTWDFAVDTTLIRVLARNAEVFPDRVAMREKSKGIWQETTWRELLDSVISCAAGLESLGFRPGDVMLVLGDNRPRLYADALLRSGALKGYAMPAFADATLDEIRHFVHEAGARFMLAEDQEQVDKILDLRDQGATIEHIIYDDPRGLNAYPNPGLILMGNGTGQRSRTAGRRPRLARCADPARAAGGPGGVRAFFRQHRQAEGRRAVAPQSARRRSKRLSGRGVRFRRNHPGLSAHRLGRRFRGDDGRRHRPSLYHQHSRAAGNRAAEPARIAPTFISPHRAAGTTSSPPSRSHRRFLVAQEIHDSSLMTAALSAEQRKLDGRAPTLKEACSPRVPVAGLRTDQGSVRSHPAARRLHRRRSHGRRTFVFYRALGIKLRQLYGRPRAAPITRSRGWTRSGCIRWGVRCRASKSDQPVPVKS